MATENDWKKLLEKAIADLDTKSVRKLLRAHKYESTVEFMREIVEVRYSNLEDEHEFGKVLSILLRGDGSDKSAYGELLCMAAQNGMHAFVKALVTAGADLQYKWNGCDAITHAMKAKMKYKDGRAYEYLAECEESIW